MPAGAFGRRVARGKSSSTGAAKSNQQERLAEELPEERARRLEHKRRNQQERMAEELPEERARRLEQLTEQPAGAYGRRVA